MPKFLFWNLNQRHIPELIARLAREELVDVLILAECAIEPAHMLEALNAERTEYDFGFTSCNRLRVFTRAFRTARRTSDHQIHGSSCQSRYGGVFLWLGLPVATRPCALDHCAFLARGQGPAQSILQSIEPLAYACLQEVRRFPAMA